MVFDQEVSWKKMNGWAQAPGVENVYWFCNEGNGLFEADNPNSWASQKLW